MRDLPAKKVDKGAKEAEKGRTLLEKASPKVPCVNPKRVRRLKREMGLISVMPKPFTTHPRQDAGFRKYPYLLHGRAITRPNQV